MRAAAVVRASRRDGLYLSGVSKHCTLAQALARLHVWPPASAPMRATRSCRSRAGCARARAGEIWMRSQVNLSPRMRARSSARRPLFGSAGQARRLRFMLIVLARSRRPRPGGQRLPGDHRAQGRLKPPLKSQPRTFAHAACRRTLFAANQELGARQLELPPPQTLKPLCRPPKPLAWWPVGASQVGCAGTGDAPRPAQVAPGPSGPTQTETAEIGAT